MYYRLESVGAHPTSVNFGMNPGYRFSSWACLWYLNCCLKPFPIPSSVQKKGK